MHLSQCMHAKVGSHKTYMITIIYSTRNICVRLCLYFYELQPMKSGNVHNACLMPLENQ